MNDNSCSNLEQNYTSDQVEALVQASALYAEAINKAIQAIGTPSSPAANAVAGIATANFTKAIQPFNYMLPEFLRHG